MVIPEDTLVILVSGALMLFLSMELFFSGIFLSPSFLTIKGFWGASLNLELPGLSEMTFLGMGSCCLWLVYLTDARPVLTETFVEGAAWADSTLASDALFFMVESLVIDSLPWEDLSFWFDDEFSLVLILSGEEYRVDVEFGSCLLSFGANGETRGAFWDYYGIFCPLFYFSRASAAAILGIRDTGY